MSTTTIFLGRLLGLYLVAISVGMLANRRRTLATLDEMARSGPWMLFSGMVATAAGLAVVLGHNVWSGGALPVVVTLTGWEDPANSANFDTKRFGQQRPRAGCRES